MISASLAGVPYAYIGEGAISDYETALVLKEEDFQDRRVTCQLFADAGGQALQAMLDRVQGSSDTGGVNLLSRLHLLRRLDGEKPRSLEGSDADDAARLLSRTLLLNRCRAGGDFVLRDLFDEASVEECHDAARLMVDAMTRRLLALPLEQVELRFYRQRRMPMTAAGFWARRRGKVGTAAV